MNETEVFRELKRRCKAESFCLSCASPCPFSDYVIQWTVTDADAALCPQTCPSLTTLRFIAQTHSYSVANMASLCIAKKRNPHTYHCLFDFVVYGHNAGT